MSVVEVIFALCFHGGLGSVKATRRTARRVQGGRSLNTVTIRRAHDLDKQTCEDALAELEHFLIAQLSARVKRTEGQLTFSGPGFDGRVHIVPGEALGKIKLGLLAAPFKHQLEQEINRQLDARLGAN